ncbi:MAG: hypothetical protein GXP01_00710, partial [Alphaproteobacteria bacterium]|nr:hypothetical protein [Alphaproteobacteria bacterium]
MLRRSDVFGWGVAAVAAFGVAVLAGNLAAGVPPGWLAVLHETRAEAGTLLPNSRTIKTLQTDLARSQRANAVLRTRMDLLEGTGTIAARRIG